MPLYEIECPTDGRAELLLPLSASDALMLPCPTCGQPCYRVHSLASVRPDSLWAGHYIENYGYVTSSKQVANIRKQRRLVEIGDRADQEAIHKTATDAAKAKKDKFAKETRAFLEAEFSGKGMLTSDGEITPEANRKLSDEPITFIDEDDPRLK